MVIAASSLLVLSCDSHPLKRDSAGWTYNSAGYMNFLTFNFGDADGTRFVGKCDSVPIFVLQRGGYPPGAERMRLSVDDQSWDLEVFQGEHSRGVIIDQPAIVAGIAHASDTIALQSGGWQRQLKPSPLLRKFVDVCRARRKIDPKGERWFN